MPSIAELVVSAKPDGVSEVESEMDSLEKSTEETTENLDQSAGKLGGLAQAFKGGMMAIVGGLAIAVGGVLTQVPVLGEALDGLKAIFTSLGLQLDQKLRPFMSDLTQELFDLSDAIAQGDYKKAKKELGDIVSVFKGVDVGGIIDSLVSGLRSLAGDVNFEELAKRFIDFRDNVLNNVIDAIANFAKNLKVEDVKSAVSTYIRILKDSFSSLIGNVDWLQLLISIATLMGKIGEGVGKAIKNEIVDPLISKIGEKFGDAVSAAKQWGKDIIDEIIKGIEAKASELKSAVGGITIAGDLTVADIAEGDFDIGGNSEDNESGTTNPYANGGFIGSRGNNSGDVYLDGRRVNYNQGRYRKDALNRRG